MDLMKAEVIRINTARSSSRKPRELIIRLDREQKSGDTVRIVYGKEKGTFFRTIPYRSRLTIKTYCHYPLFLHRRQVSNRRKALTQYSEVSFENLNVGKKQAKVLKTHLGLEIISIITNRLKTLPKPSFIFLPRSLEVFFIVEHSY